jgi:hypothetical protein
VAIVEGIMFKYHEIGCNEGILQLRVMHVAGPYAAHRLEAPLEFWEEVCGDVNGG